MFAHLEKILNISKEIDDLLKTKKLEKRLNGFVSNLGKQNNLNESKRFFLVIKLSSKIINLRFY